MTTDHDPSDYEARVLLTVQQMILIRRSVSGRVGNHIADGITSEHQEEIMALMAIGEMLDVHIDKATKGWEARVAHKEALSLNDDEALHRFLDGDK